MRINYDDYAMSTLAHYVLSCDISTRNYMAHGKSRGETPEQLRRYVQQAQRLQLNLKRDVRNCLTGGIATEGVRAHYLHQLVPADIVHNTITLLEAEHARERACLAKPQPAGGMRFNGIDV